MLLQLAKTGKTQAIEFTCIKYGCQAMEISLGVLFSLVQSKISIEK